MSFIFTTIYKQITKETGKNMIEITLKQSNLLTEYMLFSFRLQRSLRAKQTPKSRLEFRTYYRTSIWINKISLCACNHLSVVVYDYYDYYDYSQRCLFYFFSEEEFIWTHVYKPEPKITKKIPKIPFTVASLPQM